MTAPIKKQSCPTCKYGIENVTPIGKENKNAIPEPGNWCVCLSCGEILHFNNELKLKIAIQQDLATLELMDHIQILYTSNLIKKEKPLQNKNYGK